MAFLASGSYHCRILRVRVIPVTAEWGKRCEPADFDAAFRAASGRSRGSGGPPGDFYHGDKPGRRDCGGGTPAWENVYGGRGFVDGRPAAQMDEWGVDLCATASQKCLGAPPGLALAAVGRGDGKRSTATRIRRHGWYGDLRVWNWYAKTGATGIRFRLPWRPIMWRASYLALQHLLAEGIPQRLERYSCLAMRLRDGLRRIGFEPFTPDEAMAPVFSPRHIHPKGRASGRMVGYMEDEHRIKISTGLGMMKEN